MLIQPLEARLSTKIVDRSSEKNLNSRFPTQGVSCITPPLVYPRWASAGVVKTKNPSRTPKGPRRRAGGAVLLPSCERRRYMLAQLERLLRAGVRREARPRKLQLTLGLVKFTRNESVRVRELPPPWPASLTYGTTTRPPTTRDTGYRGSGTTRPLPCPFS